MQLLRYYVIFIYFSSFLWKIAGGFFLNPEEGQAIISNGIDFWLFEQKNSVSSTIYTYFLNHQLISYILIILGSLSQAFFCVGFFTKKYDTILFVLPFIFHTFAYYFIDVSFLD